MRTEIENLVKSFVDGVERICEEASQAMIRQKLNAAFGNAEGVPVARKTVAPNLAKRPMAPKPCPKCGKENTRPRFKFYCGDPCQAPAGTGAKQKKAPKKSTKKAPKAKKGKA